MITLITGTPGAGKTAWTVQEIIRLPSQRKIFVHGIPALKIPHDAIYCKSPLCDICQKIPDDDKLYYVEDWPQWATPGSLIICDEIQRIWGAANAGSIKSDDISSLQTHRHIGLDFWLISQSPKLLHTGVRTLVGRHIHLVSRWSGRTEYEFPECRDNTESRSDAVSRPYKLPKHVFSKYQSSSLHTKLSHRKPLALYFFALILMILAGFGYRIYNRISTFDQEIDKTESIAAKEKPSSVVNSPPREVFNTSYPDFKPSIPGVPASAPAYAKLNQVTQVPHIIGCVKTPDFCRCYTRQAVSFPVSLAFCKSYLAGNYFNPFRTVSGGGSADDAHSGGGASATRNDTKIENHKKTDNEVD